MAASSGQLKSANTAVMVAQARQGINQPTTISSVGQNATLAERYPRLRRRAIIGDANPDRAQAAAIRKEERDSLGSRVQGGNRARAANGRSRLKI
jgi:hypothetical protein